MTVFKNKGRDLGPGGPVEKAVLIIALVGLILAVVGGVVAAKYAAKADSLWNRQGYAKAYGDVKREMKASNPGAPVDQSVLSRKARSRMWDPGYVPARSGKDQKVANIFGLIGFLGFLGLLLLGIDYLYIKRKDIFSLFKKKRLFDDVD